MRAPDLKTAAPVLAALAAYVLLFGSPLAALARDWWNDPDAGHGLLLAPLAVWLAWKSRPKHWSGGQPVLGASLLVGAILLRYVSGLAAEVFTTRLSALGAIVGIVTFVWGYRQLLVWWLPIALLGLSIPLPSLIMSTLALPLQFKASQMGAALLEARHVPVRLTGNIIMLPGHSLFVTEACSGLRSLTALLSLGVMIGGLWLNTVVGRIGLIVLAIPVAILINAVRVFLTGFLVFFVSPAMGDGFMHVTEGWLMFVVAFAMLGGIAWAISRTETWIKERRHG